MKWIINIMVISMFSLSTGCSDEPTKEITVQYLKCDYMKEGIVARQSPRFSWELVSEKNGQKQTAWQVIVSDDPENIKKGEGNVWDSGKENGDQTFSIKYDGDELQ